MYANTYTHTCTNIHTCTSTQAYTNTHMHAQGALTGLPAVHLPLCHLPTLWLPSAFEFPCDSSILNLSSSRFTHGQAGPRDLWNPHSNA